MHHYQSSIVEQPLPPLVVQSSTTASSSSSSAVDDNKKQKKKKKKKSKKNPLHPLTRAADGRGYDWLAGQILVLSPPPPRSFCLSYYENFARLYNDIVNHHDLQRLVDFMGAHCHPNLIQTVSFCYHPNETQVVDPLHFFHPSTTMHGTVAYLRNALSMMRMIPDGVSQLGNIRIKAMGQQTLCVFPVQISGTIVVTLPLPISLWQRWKNKQLTMLDAIEIRRLFQRLGSYHSLCQSISCEQMEMLATKTTTSSSSSSSSASSNVIEDNTSTTIHSTDKSSRSSSNNSNSSTLQHPLPVQDDQWEKLAQSLEAEYDHVMFHLHENMQHPKNTEGKEVVIETVCLPIRIRGVMQLYFDNPQVKNVSEDNTTPYKKPANLVSRMELTYYDQLVPLQQQHQQREQQQPDGGH
eukprot:scaffold14717_cov168-Ochromonas_danica.AAC.3